MNIKLLKEKLKEKKITVKDLSKNLNIDRATFYRKLNKNGEDFTIKDMLKIYDCLNLTNEDAISIFFKTYVA